MNNVNETMAEDYPDAYAGDARCDSDPMTNDSRSSSSSSF